MKINQEADLTILLQYGWNNQYRNCYYKIFKGNGIAEISLVINPVNTNLDFMPLTREYSHLLQVGDESGI